MTTTDTQDVPQDLVDDQPVKPVKVRKTPAKAAPTDRAPTDPLTVHLWRYLRPVRVALLLPFVGHRVKLERWFGRIAANGDQTYHGDLLAVAQTTIGSAADLVILKETGGDVWAISTAQIAYLELDEPAKPKMVRAARKPKDPTPATAKLDPAPRTARRRKSTPEVPGDTAA